MAILEEYKKTPRPVADQDIDTTLWSDEAKSDLARSWRDEELKKSDWIASIPDHGMHASYMTYRAALRDWPSTSDFPDNKPTL